MWWLAGASTVALSAAIGLIWLARPLPYRPSLGPTNSHYFAGRQRRWVHCGEPLDLYRISRRPCDPPISYPGAIT